MLQFIGEPSLTTKTISSTYNPPLVLATLTMLIFSHSYPLCWALLIRNGCRNSNNVQLQPKEYAAVCCYILSRCRDQSWVIDKIKEVKKEKKKTKKMLLLVNVTLVVATCGDAIRQRMTLIGFKTPKTVINPSKRKRGKQRWTTTAIVTSFIVQVEHSRDWHKIFNEFWRNEPCTEGYPIWSDELILHT